VTVTTSCPSTTSTLSFGGSMRTTQSFGHPGSTMTFGGSQVKARSS
jgi:hypothetical protein